MRRFLSNCKRVLRIARKPGKDEYLQVAKITGLGITLIGLIGFLILLVGVFLGTTTVP
ncbi:MAG: protein translocase SEC61 complex subunit gamma [Hadesarchaea archaeon]|nr:MAG: protein translocase SEC61 complex subunit gamma [Hadesarchaea archaeon]TKJ26672.1 MAG: protein translocase SEC61 complex subunit gamma [Hadesarchaea archaeon B3_Hades]